MQMMTWPLGRLGSRFGLLFEPGKRRIMHSALGRFLDRPLDLAVGLIEPDGTERVLPFTQHGEVLYGCEQFERINSITFRGHSEASGLRFELNLHSPFYPQDEPLCMLPAFYVELRAVPAHRVRRRRVKNIPKKVRMFIRLSRPETQIGVVDNRIDLNYAVRLDPRYEAAVGNDTTLSSTDNIPTDPEAPTVQVVERLVSLNEGVAACTGPQGGTGLTLELPVTEEGSGIKWRLVWAAHVAEPVLRVDQEPATFRYTKHWPNLDEVLRLAIERRDDNLARSRRFEKVIEQAPLTRARWHLLVMAFHSYLASTFWCQRPDGSEWFSVLEGTSMFHGTVDVEYNLAMFYFTLWPRLLTLQFDQWATHVTEHEPSGGLILNHDMGRGMKIGSAAYDHAMPVEENSNFLLLLQAYSHWTGNLKPLKKHTEVVRRFAEYLLWTDRDDSGFASEGTANTLDGSVAVQFARKQTYLAIKRVGALDAAADLLDRVDQREVAERCRTTAANDVPKIEAAAWLNDHYAVCVDRDTRGLIDTWSGEPLPVKGLVGWDDYSIYTPNGLLLPMIIAQPLAFDADRLHDDIFNAQREALCPYGCGHTSSDSTNIWISSNLWRDFVGEYLNVHLLHLDSRYWDMLVYSNTNGQSMGYCDTYIGNELAFYPRGAVSFGYFLAGPRLQIDRLDGEYFAVTPPRHRAQRWPLLPLADWGAGKIPICVVDRDGRAVIEGEIEPVKILGHEPAADGIIG
ncbi:DUF4965 domain-containing protein [Planctomycetales bacterium ZRK34]|nr:DUF4965 domain-containing protein [Planctomycetales bacterium ZRK34]